MPLLVHDNFVCLDLVCLILLVRRAVASLLEQQHVVR